MENMIQWPQTIAIHENMLILTSNQRNTNENNNE